MHARRRWAGLFLAVFILSATGVSDEASDAEFKKLDWKKGPCVGRLGSVARIEVPEGFAFLEAEEAKKFDILNQNIPPEEELGILLSMESNWFMSFSFHEVGYVKDEEKDSLDADKLLAEIKEGTEAANEERRKRGWEEMKVLGWEFPPRYNSASHNLEWCIKGASGTGTAANWNTRLLGRRGYMSIVLVGDPSAMSAIAPTQSNLLAKFEYVEGQKYAEYTAGDVVAKVGLAALIVGGGAAVAAKAGLLKKFGKLILAAIVGAGALVKKFWNRMTGKMET